MPYFNAPMQSIKESKDFHPQKTGKNGIDTETHELPSTGDPIGPAVQNPDSEDPNPPDIDES